MHAMFEQEEKEVVEVEKEEEIMRINTSSLLSVIAKAWPSRELLKPEISISLHFTSHCSASTTTCVRQEISSEKSMSTSVSSEGRRSIMVGDFRDRSELRDEKEIKSKKSITNIFQSEIGTEFQG